MFETNIPDKDIAEALENILKRFEDDSYAFQVFHTGGGYQFLTKPSYQASIGILLKQQSKKRLSNAALETLSIIAYKQPITKAESAQQLGQANDARQMENQLGSCWCYLFRFAVPREWHLCGVGI